MRRITVEEVRAAYAKTGLRPARGNFFSDFRDGDARFPSCGCALGALYMARTASARASTTDVWATLGLKSDYANAFAIGFDGEKLLLPRRAEVAAGYEDGQAAARAVFGEAQP